jgi:hypothetical protein
VNSPSVGESGCLAQDRMAARQRIARTPRRPQRRIESGGRTQTLRVLGTRPVKTRRIVADTVWDFRSEAPELPESRDGRQTVECGQVALLVSARSLERGIEMRPEAETGAVRVKVDEGFIAPRRRRSRQTTGVWCRRGRRPDTASLSRQRARVASDHSTPGADQTNGVEASTCRRACGPEGGTRAGRESVKRRNRSCSPAGVGDHREESRGSILT